MNPDERRQSEELFHRMVELPADEREAYLAENCRLESVRVEVERLLAVDKKLGARLDDGPSERPLDVTRASASPTAMARAAGAVVAERFEIVELVGRGGMGEVYLATDLRLRRKVALKFLNPSLAPDGVQRARFLAEARSASALNHPNVCVIHEVGELDDGSPFLAFEFLEGEGMEERLRRGPFEIPEVLTLATQLVDALDAAHSAGLVHRDIKPSNLHLTPRGQLKVLDFGLAKRVGTDEADAAVTQPGSVLGTPLYMSPEQALGHTIDARSDIFSVGVVLYEMVTGRRPFTGQTVAEVAVKIAHAAPDAIARHNYDTPLELERIILKCLEKNPEERYPSARDLLVDLRRLGRDASATKPDIGASSVRDTTALVDPFPVSLPAVPAPEELRGSDVFISYAAVDDHALPHETHGWISGFHRNLEIRLEQLCGERVRIWRVPGTATAESEPGAPEGVDEVKTMVSVVSPPFVKSSACCDHVAKFRDAAENEGRFRLSSGSRLFKVVKRPVPADDVPPRLQSVLSDLLDHDFFDIDPATGRVREYSESTRQDLVQRYHERIYDLAEEISGVLRDYRQTGETVEIDAAQKTFYLATTTSELDRERDRLRRELVARGHMVLPDRPLPVVGVELTNAVRLHLERCDYAIHPIGGLYGVVPEGLQESTLEIQNRLAAEHSKTAALQRLIWIPRDLQVHDERQASWIEALRLDPVEQEGAEIIEGSLEVLRGEIISLLEVNGPELQRLAPGVDSTAVARPPRLFLICLNEDEQNIEPIEDFFFDRGIEVALPAFGAAAPEREESQLRSLTACDAVLVYFGAAERHWVEFTLHDIAKAAGYRDRGPIALSAVYVAPPVDRRKQRFRSLTAEVIRAGDAFDPDLLTPFAEKLREVRR